jgi:hypothetical protein
VNREAAAVSETEEGNRPQHKAAATAAPISQKEGRAVSREARFKSSGKRCTLRPSDFPGRSDATRSADCAGLPFLRQLHCIINPASASEMDVTRLFEMANCDATHRSMHIACGFVNR